MTPQVPRRRPSRAYASALAAHLRLDPLEPRTLFSAAPATPASLVAQANNAFAFDLYHELAHNQSGNMFFSPYSIATALELALQGATGTSASEIIQTLHLPSTDLAQAGIQALYQLFKADPATAGYTLSTANRLWVKDNFPLLNSFVTNAQNLFGAGAQSVDFGNPQAAADTINAWVSDQTHGKIPNLIAPEAIDGLTRLILTNAIYFKGDWASAFESYATQDASFQKSATDTSTVRMMYQDADFGYYAQSGPDGFQALDLPYQNNNVDMLVILPTSSTLDAFQSSLTPDLFSQITAGLRPADVSVFLPKFKLEESYNLNGPLQDLGIHAAFDPSAGLGAISPSPEKLSIGAVFHKSFIQVDEKGTEAAAATGITVTTGCVFTPPIPVLFRADHPFLFAIRDRATNTILFMGQVTDPGYDTSTDTTPTTPANPPPSILGPFRILGPFQPPRLFPVSIPSPTPVVPVPSPPAAAPPVVSTIRLALATTPRRQPHTLSLSHSHIVVRARQVPPLTHDILPAATL